MPITSGHLVDEVLIDIGAPGTIDEKFAHKLAVIYHDGALYHFYCAVSGKWPNDTRGLAVARSKPLVGCGELRFAENTASIRPLQFARESGDLTKEKLLTQPFWSNSPPA